MRRRWQIDLLLFFNQFVFRTLQSVINSCLGNFCQRFINYNGNVLFTGSNIALEMVDKRIHNMEVGKASGIDGLSTEHITFAHH